MSIGSTRKVTASSASKVEKRFSAPNNHSQFIENIDTTNNVLVGDDQERNNHNYHGSPSSQEQPTDFTSASPDISTSIEALALSGIYDETPNTDNKHKVNVYTNNQSIIKDEDIERTGRNYLKHFYEKNEHIIDVDELV